VTLSDSPEVFVAELHLTRRQREDPLVATWVRGRDWLGSNGRIVAWVLGGLALAALVAVVWTRSRAQAEQRAANSLAEAQALYWRGDYPTLLARADEVRKNYGGTQAATEALRLKGDAFFWQGDFKSAAQNYEQYIKENRTESAYRKGVRRNLAQAYESDNQGRKAAELYEEMAGEPGPRVLTAELYVSAARAWRAAGDPAKAKALYQKVSNEYTDTVFGADADIALGEMEAAGR
jgi:tetratricopeptide (TPR) repeat protein